MLTLPGTFGSQSTMPSELEGAVTDGQTVAPVNYEDWNILPTPGGLAGVVSGTALLNQELLSTPGPKVIFGDSLGAVVMNYWLGAYGPTSTVPPSQVTFVEIGDSTRRYGGDLTANTTLGYLVDGGLSAPTNSPYQVIDIARQYDGWADYPNNPASPYYLLAVIDADIGGNTLHTSIQT